MKMPFLSINQPIANKKAINRPKDQINVRELERIKKMKQRNDRKICFKIKGVLLSTPFILKQKFISYGMAIVFVNAPIVINAELSQVPLP